MKGTINPSQQVQISDLKLLNKGPLDFKLYWTYIEEKYFNSSLSKTPAQILNKVFQLAHEETALKDNKKDEPSDLSYLEEFLSAKDHFTKPTLINKVFGLNLLTCPENLSSLEEGIISPKSTSTDTSRFTKCTNATDKGNSPSKDRKQIKKDLESENIEVNLTSKFKSEEPFSSQIHRSARNSRSISKEPIGRKLTECEEMKEKGSNAHFDQVSFEIELIEKLLSKLKFDSLVAYISNQIAKEQLSNKISINHEETSLLNIQKQIQTLQLTQFAESITNVHINKAKNLYYVTLDKTENLPMLELSEETYKYMMSFMDTSNFIISYDKPLNSQFNPNLPVDDKPKKKKNTAKEKELDMDTCIKRGLVQIADNVKADCQICHNCKMRKPIELMTKCRNKYLDRPFKVFYLYNMILLNKNFKFYIYVDYKGDIKDLQSQLTNKNLVENHCDKYFCHFCLRGSYQTNPEKNVKIQNTKEVKKGTQPKNQPIVTNKLNAITKDWCCPWCTHECFCSRCVREEHIFKMLSLYIYNKGNLGYLRNFVKDGEIILETLEEYTVAFNTVVKDGMIVERVNKTSSKYRNKATEPKKETESNEKNLSALLSKLIKVKESEEKILEKVSSDFLDIYKQKLEIEFGKPKIEEQQIEKVPQKKRGRKAKVKSDDSLKTLTEIKESVVVKRKRGRPPKFKPVVEEKKIQKKARKRLKLNSSFIVYAKSSRSKRKALVVAQKGFHEEKVKNDEKKELRRKRMIQEQARLLRMYKKLANLRKNEKNLNNESEANPQEASNNRYLEDEYDSNIRVNEEVHNEDFNGNRANTEVKKRGRKPKNRPYLKLSNKTGKKAKQPHHCKYNLKKAKTKLVKKKVIKQLEDYPGTEIVVFPVGNSDSYSHNDNIIKELKQRLDCDCKKEIEENSTSSSRRRSYDNASLRKNSMDTLNGNGSNENGRPVKESRNRLYKIVINKRMKVVQPLKRFNRNVVYNIHK